MSSESSRYLAILKNSHDVSFFEPANRTIAEQKANANIHDTLLTTTAMVTAPVLLAYTAWVLDDAKKRGFRRLYFLARDGYAMYKMAQLLCKAWGINLECHYFYCSRIALRRPLYISAKEYALERIFDLGFNITAVSVCKRAGIGLDDTLQLLRKIDWPPELRLTVSNILLLRKRLERDRDFDKLVTVAAEESMTSVRGYFTQECSDIKSDKIALVDSGWLGSMQECFCRNYNQIFNTNTKIDGYYFGMFSKENLLYGRNHCWCFSPKHNYGRIAWFNNNLFECLCAADHPMTVGYENCNGRWIPVFAAESDYGHAKEQLEICERYTQNFIEANPKPVETKDLDKTAYALLKKLMTNPTRKEAEFYGGLRFSDDAANSNIIGLAESLTLEEYKRQGFFAKVQEKLFRRSDDSVTLSFWVEASLQRGDIMSLWVKLDLALIRFSKLSIALIKSKLQR